MICVHTAVTERAGQDQTYSDDVLQKEEPEAIETLLRNTKAKIDDIDPEQMVKKDQMDTVEILLRETQNTINEIVSQLGEVPKPEDVAVIEAMVKEISATIVELKEKGMSEE